MFASRSILEHLVRGILGVAAIGVAIGQGSLLVGLLALPVALFAFRGCPSCWLVGLFETVHARKQRNLFAEGRCRDGSYHGQVSSPRAIDQ